MLVISTCYINYYNLLLIQENKIIIIMYMYVFLYIYILYIWTNIELQ